MWSMWGTFAALYIAVSTGTMLVVFITALALLFGVAALQIGRAQARERAATIAVDIAAMAVDVAAMAYSLWRAGSMLAAVPFTVWCDPLSRSNEAIPLRGTRRNMRGFSSFVVVQGACDQREQYTRRIAAWFYRWHREPSPADWDYCCTLFGLRDPPPHTLRLLSAPQAAAAPPATVCVILTRSEPNAASLVRSYHFRLIWAQAEKCEMREGHCDDFDLLPSSFVHESRWVGATAVATPSPVE